MSRRPSAARLLGDIGGTNARFATQSPDGAIGHVRVLRAADHAGLAEAAEAYLAAEKTAPRPTHAAFAVASPIEGDSVAFTNSPWSFSIGALRDRLGLERLAVVNDFVAVALAVPRLDPGERTQIGTGKAAAGAPIAVFGPGTGLGVAALVPNGERWITVATEGGHATLAADDDREAAAIAKLREMEGHVSAERVLSGPGLVNLYGALADLDRVAAAPLAPNEITARALAGTDRTCRQALDMFCAMLGGFAGNLALTYGALGGVYIAGGIVPDFIPYLAASAFRARFEAKGRFRDYLRRIPSWVITHPQPAFVGLASLVET